MKQEGVPAVGINIPPAPQDYMGLCRKCVYKPANLPNKVVTTRNKIYRESICGKTKGFCFLERHSLFECDYYEATKSKNTLVTIGCLFKATITSIKQNNWTPLKEAVKNELQD